MGLTCHKRVRDVAALLELRKKSPKWLGQPYSIKYKVGTWSRVGAVAEDSLRVCLDW